jgi:hypothetical protein
MPRDDRTRRKKSAGRKSGANVLVVVAVLGSAFLMVVAGGVVAAVYFSRSRSATSEATAAGATAPPVAPNVPFPNVPGALSPAPPPKLPEGWAYNHPRHGFRAAWPVVAGGDGYAPDRIFGSVTGGNMRSYLDESSGLAYGVTWSDLSYIPGADAIEPLVLVDRFLDRQRQKAEAKGHKTDAVQILPATTGGVPGREVRVKGGVQRYVAIHGKVWILAVMIQATEVNPTDPRVTTFFDGFAAVK